MSSIQKEIAKLKNLLNIDNTYFILEIYQFMEHIIKQYLGKDLDCDFDRNIEALKFQLNQNIDESLRRHQNTVLNQVKEFFVAVKPYKVNDNLDDIKSKNVIVFTYELSKMFKYESIVNNIRYIFSNYLKEFENIDLIYNTIDSSDFIKLDENFNQKLKSQMDKEEIYGIKSQLQEIDGNIHKYNKIINKDEFKNKYLKYDTTHLEYQKKYWALSDAQSQIIESIFANLKGCFYIDGVAGSGKSMVLLKLFEMINNRDITNTSYFLTFTNSLVKFDKNGLINTKYPKHIVNNIKTVDGYFSFNLKLDFKEYKVLRDQITSNDNSILITLIERSITIFNENGGDCTISAIDAYELIEHQIFENLYDRDTCSRKFNSLDLYFISEIYKSLQLNNKVLSKAFSIICMIDAIKINGRDGYTDYILVDEAQDLTLAQIELLRLSSKKALILAGDTNQSIYLKKSCFEDLPFKIKQYKLSENYRNTYEIKTLAKSYLESFNNTTSIKKVVYEKKSNGLRPRLFKCSDVNSTIDLLIKKIKIDIEEFNLDLKDILIICPSNYAIKQVIDRIEYPIMYLKDKDVDFNKSSIKISTIYSSKGCGFAYIYLFIDNKIYVNNSFDESEREEVLKRLIYVSLTRSLNSLNIFIPLSKIPLKPIYNLLEIME